MAIEDGALDLFRKWVAAKPNSAFARLFLVVCLTISGREIRGSPYAD